MTKARPVDPNLELKNDERRNGGNILKLKNVNKKFGDRIMLDDMTYDFNAGDTIGVVGVKYVDLTKLLKS
jgi:ATPase subunit of ABC transporter with duplicated ATPase domains